MAFRMIGFGKRTAVFFATTFVLFISNLGNPFCRAAEFTWINPSGGLFSEPSNWLPNSIPGEGDTVLFSNPSAYAINVDLSVTNGSAFFHQGMVTQMVAGGAWFLTNQFEVGAQAGATARAFIASGLLSVTNESGLGRIMVGESGTGEFGIVGGSVVADFVEADNQAQSIVSFHRGELTTLKGSRFRVNNTKLILGGAKAGDVFTWNVLGGTNLILTGQFDYGGLTMGGSGRSVVNLSGPETLLSVIGLDGVGNNVLSIRNGAKLRTQRVQWGIHSGENNTVIISDPGSSWTNSGLMYFGMHAGNQTLIVTNGGTFWSSGAGQSFDFLHNANNRITVDGTNSLFQVDSYAFAGMIYCSPNPCQLDNLILVTNGGNFRMQQLRFGAPGAGLGSKIHVAGGNLWMGKLELNLGDLKISSGTGLLNQLVLTNGTSGVLEAHGTLFIGRNEPLQSGDIQVGSSISIIPSLNGELRLGGWSLGSGVGDHGAVTVTGGRIFVTNSTQDAELIVGDKGSGTLQVNGGELEADVVKVGAQVGSTGELILDGLDSRLSTSNLYCGVDGTVNVTDSALLRLNHGDAPAGAISVLGATLEFGTSAPTIPLNGIVVSNGVISYSDVSAASIALTNPACLGRIQRVGQVKLQLNNSTNLLEGSVVLDANSSSTWSGLNLTGGINALKTSGLLIEPGAMLLASNTFATVTGSVTNHGNIVVHKSTLRFADRVRFSATTSLNGLDGIVFFDGGLDLPESDIIVPPGVTISASDITTAGGRLIVDGGTVIASANGDMSSSILLQDAWVMYLDHPAAPVTPPANLVWSGSLGIQLVRSTNESLFQHTFQGGGNGYSRLRLGAGSRWNSVTTVIGSGGAIHYADTTAVFSPGSLQVGNGGSMLDETGAMSCIGFPVNVAEGGNWRSANAICVGSGSDAFRVGSGGQLFSQTGTISGSGARVEVDGPGSVWYSTNSLTLGSNARLEVNDGALLAGSQILINGSLASIVVAQDGIINSSNLVLSGSSARLSVTNAGTIMSSNAVIGSSIGAVAELSGAGSSWQSFGPLTVGAALFLNRTNFLELNEKATLTTPSLTLNPGRSALNLQEGSLFVTNGSGTAVFSMNGRFNFDRGLLVADSLLANNAAAHVQFRAGRAEWRSSDFHSNVPLRIGDSNYLASLKLKGGTNTVRGGLEIRPFASLTGSGVIVGAVTNKGVIKPGTLIIRSNLVLSPTSDLVFKINAAPASPSNSNLEVTGNVVLAGKFSIALSMDDDPLPDDIYVLVQHNGASGNFSNITAGRVLTQKRLASFRIDFGANTVSATDYRSEDLDGDGINDNWAQEHFGISSLPSGTGTHQLDGDLDGDGLSNRNEFLIQTNPADPSSGMALTLHESGSGGRSLVFPYHPGAFYAVMISEDLTIWDEVSIEELEFDQSGRAIWRESLSVGERRFYRIRVQTE